MAQSSYLFFLCFSVVSLQSMNSTNINVLNTATHTPLHSAISAGHESAAKLLLAKGARIDARVLPSQRTPLMFSAQYNQNAIAVELLKKDAPVDEVDKDNMTALHIACKEGYAEVVETLVAAGASVNRADTHGNNAFNYACLYKESKDPAILIALQKAVKKKQDAAKAKEGFLLHRACQADSAEGIEELVLKGLKIDELDKTGNSPLHYAAVNVNHPEIITALVAAAEKKAAQDSDAKKETPAAPAPLASATIPAANSGSSSQP